MPEDDETSFNSPEISTTPKIVTLNSARVNDLSIILDGWKDCDEDDKYVCTPPEKDDRFDINQLSIFQALPMSLPYSEVGVLVEDFDEEERRKSVTRPFTTPRQAPVVKQTIKGSPLQYFHPKSTLHGRFTKRSTLTKPPIRPLPDTNSPILIFHDLFRSQKEWQAFAADLAAMLRRRVIAVDLRNHGTSFSNTSVCGLGEFLADFRGIFKELKLSESKVSLIGHGISGWCAMIFSLLFPYKVRNIITIEANPTDNYYMRNAALKLESALSRIQPPPRGRTLTDLKLKISDYLKNDLTNVNLRIYAVENIVVRDVIGKPEKWLTKKSQLVTSLNSFSIFPNFLKSYIFDKPALFVASVASKILKPEDEPNVLKLFPQAEFIYYEKVTRNPHVELFDDFLDIVKDFLIND